MSICLTNLRICDKIAMSGRMPIQIFFKASIVRAAVALPDIPRSWRAAMLKTAVYSEKLNLKGIKNESKSFKRKKRISQHKRNG